MKHIQLFEEFVDENLKAKKPNEVITVDIDFAGSDADLRKLQRTYNLKATEPNPGQVLIQGKKKDILGYLQSDEYSMDAEDIEDLFPELLESDVVTIKMNRLNEEKLSIKESSLNERKDWYDFKPEKIAKAFMDNGEPGEGPTVTTDQLDRWLGDFAYFKKIEDGLPYDVAEDIVNILKKKGYRKLDVDNLQTESVNEFLNERKDWNDFNEADLAKQFVKYAKKNKIRLPDGGDLADFMGQLSYKHKIKESPEKNFVDDISTELMNYHLDAALSDFKERWESDGGSLYFWK
jgi:hypothetical protein